MKKITIKEFVRYNGHNVKPNTTISLGFKAMYSELTKTIQVLQLLNNDVKIEVDKKPLGVFRVKNVSVSDDGESTLKFESMTEAVEMDNLNSLINADGELKIVMESVVDMEDGNNEIEDDEEEDENEAAQSDDEDEEDDDEDWDEDEDDEDWSDVEDE